MKKYKMKTKWQYILIAFVISTILVMILNYFWVSPWNLKSIECWMKIFVILGIYSGMNLCFCIVDMKQKR